jgi:hypothetical protein
MIEAEAGDPFGREREERLFERPHGGPAVWVEVVIPVRRCIGEVADAAPRGGGGVSWGGGDAARMERK